MSSGYERWYQSLFGSPHLPTEERWSSYWPELNRYLTECDASLSQLKPTGRFTSMSDDTIPLITTLHNQRGRLPDFLRHYRALGIGRFLIVDHRSSDGTSEYLASQDDVDLFQTNASFAATVGGQMWITGLARKYALGRWVVHVDGDELLVYHGMERHGIPDLARLLDARGMSRLYAPMLDMYPAGPIADAKLRVGMRMIDVAPLFDPLVSEDGTTYYERIPRYGRTILLSTARMKKIGSPIADKLGYPIKHVMDKYPLSRWHDRTAFCSVHFPYPFLENSDRQLGALLHFKFMGDFERYNLSVAEMGEAWSHSVENEYYARRVQEWPSLSLNHPFSLRFAGPDMLVHVGFISEIAW